MIVAVTGGTGFIGSRLVANLVANRHQVRVLTRKKVCSTDTVNYFHGDLANDSDLSSWLEGVDVLFHCAGEITNVSSMHNLHVDGTKRLINAAAGKIVRWVQLSSTGAYGQIRYGNVNEETPLNPVGLYELTKVASDRLVSSAAESGLFEHVILRPSVVFGSEMPNQSLYAMLKMIKRGLFFFIGSKNSSANYIHVDNVVAGLMACGFVDRARGQVFNISDTCTMNQFVEMIASELGVFPPKTCLPEWPVRKVSGLLEQLPYWPLKTSRIDALTSFVTYPTYKIEEFLNYSHPISMSMGIADLVSFYRSREI